MTTAPSNHGCIAPEDIDAFLRGDLPASPRAELKRHILSCPACRELVSVLVKLRSRPPSPPDQPSTATPGGAAEAPLPSGTRVGRYVVIERLGEGGMGVVYAAHDPELARKVAIKLLRGDFGPAEQQPLRERLRREAQAMAQMAHPNVVTVYDVGAWSDRIFIAMELVEGQTLSQWLAAAPRSWQQLLAVFLPAGEGLAAAHKAGLVHRDFKPANVFIGADGRVRVGDFGLAAIAAESAQPSADESGELAAAVLRGAVRSMAGTPYYMAPEELLGAPAGARGDQFSFCVALHAALTGEHPFAGEGVEENVRAVVAGRRRTVRAHIPRRLRRALVRGLSIDPADRFPTMRELLEALAGSAPRRSARAAALAAAVVLAVAGLAGLRWSQLRHAGRADQAHTAPRYEAAVFDRAAEAQRAYHRERIAFNTGACESPRAGCAIRSANLLRDAGFDGHTPAWGAAHASPATRLAWSGDHLVISSTDPDATAAQEVPWIIPPGQSYRLSASVRAQAGRVSGQLTLWGIGPRGPTSASTPFVAGLAWSPVSVTFSPKGHYERFRAEIHLDAPGSVEVDSAELVETGLIDASFEDASQAHRSAAWRPLNLAPRIRFDSIETDAFDGSRVFQVSTDQSDGSFAQDTPQSPLAGTTYTLGAWLRAGPGATRVRGNMVLWALGEEQQLAITGFDVGAGWTRVETSLDIDRPGYTALRAEFYIGTVDAPLQVDAVELTPAGLVDPSFEQGSTAWRAEESAVTARRVVDPSPRGPTDLFTPRPRPSSAQNGAHWLEVRSRRPNGAVEQLLSPPPRGANLTFSVWVRAAAGSPGPVVGHVAIEALGGATETGRSAFRAGADWTLVTTTLEIRRDDHTAMRVAVALAEAGAALDIDGARLIGPSFVPAALLAE